MFMSVSITQEGSTNILSVEYEEGVTWGTLLKDFQQALAGAGYIFDVEFDMESICLEAHDEFMNKRYPPYPVFKKAAKKA